LYTNIVANRTYAQKLVKEHLPQQTGTLSQTQVLTFVRIP